MTVPAQALTAREADVLRIVRNYSRAFGESPTRREIGEALGISRPTVELHLQRMRDKGVLRLQTRWRVIALVSQGNASA